MKIYSMTATFGKLERQTLTLEPGLNVIEAPNEWGKSTWCAFLVAMLYGIDTRERTKQGVLADKTRYAPWSGSPMSGRIDLCWNGRDITIERSSRGRSIMGEFQAYETETGLPVPELTAANCGQVLLGVEKTVFTRAGFIKLTDLPVSDDEALRRRLNALVTTGDESGASDDLGEKLKTLKNRCRHNRTGLLPQAEQQRDELNRTLDQLRQLRLQSRELTQEQADIAARLKKLENHQVALEYEKSRADALRVEEATAAREKAKEALEQLQSQCSALPDRETCHSQILHLEQLQLQQDALNQQALPAIPLAPQAPSCFAGMTPAQALQQSQKDTTAYSNLDKPVSPLLPALSGACLVAAVALLIVVGWMPALAPLVLGSCLIGFWLNQKKQQSSAREAIAARYPELPPEKWVSTAQAWAADTADYEKEYQAYQAACDRYNQSKAALAENMDNCTGGLSLNEAIRAWQQNIDKHEQLLQAQQHWQQARQHAATLSDMVKAAPQPDFADELTLTAPQTMQAIADLRARQRNLQTLSGQLAGKMETLGQETSLAQKLEAVTARIQKLEDVYAATSLALEVLKTAADNLQRKFAPRIAQRAQALFSGLTGGRYDRLALSQDLSLQTAAADEINLQPALWRSDGTVDQLYLALRLAVAEELTPRAPLVLDDALVRFDETRLKQAMDILKDAAQERQVILFTCQNREKHYL